MDSDILLLRWPNKSSRVSVPCIPVLTGGHYAGGTPQQMAWEIGCSAMEEPTFNYRHASLIDLHRSLQLYSNRRGAGNEVESPLLNWNTEENEKTASWQLPQDLRTWLVIAPHQAHLPLLQENHSALCQDSGQVMDKTCPLGLSGNVLSCQGIGTEPSPYK